MKRFLEKIQEAEKELKTIDHIIYVTFPLLKDKNILIKSLLGIKEAIVKCINSILQYEYLHKRIELSNDPNKNFMLFKEKCSKIYFIDEKEISTIERLFDLAKSHRKSPMEFIKEGRVVILSDNMLKKTFTVEDIKIFLEMSKKVIQKTKGVFQKIPSF
jgi:phosphopantetheinyl transferase (holo-ACP synthase)